MLWQWAYGKEGQLGGQMQISIRFDTSGCIWEDGQTRCLKCPSPLASTITAENQMSQLKANFIEENDIQSNGDPSLQHDYNICSSSVHTAAGATFWTKTLHLQERKLMLKLCNLSLGCGKQWDKNALTCRRESEVLTTYSNTKNWTFRKSIHLSNGT